MTKKERLKQTLLMIEDTFDENERMFHEFFEIAPEGITIVDVATLSFVKCNSNALQLLKYTLEEMLTLGPLQISPIYQPDGRRSDEKAQELIIKALNGEKVVFEWLITDGRGYPFIAEVRLAALSNNDSPQIYASFMDITERKMAQKRIENQNKRLYEIAVLQSHQVRKPIASIMGLINLFNFTDTSDPLNAELLLKIQSTTGDFDKLINEITKKTHQIKNDEEIL